MVELAWRHCSHSLSNSVSKLFSKILMIDYDGDFCSMASVSVLYFYHFILYILLEISSLLNTFWLLMCSNPFFECLFCSSSFYTIYFYIATQSYSYCSGQLLLFEIDEKEQTLFSTLFPLQLYIFHLDNICVILYTYFL